MYQQMAQDLQVKINRGDLAPGAAAPSESELIAQYSVSSTTARRCLNELAQSGLVRRVQGKGTFVAEFASINALHQIGIFYHDLIDLTDAFVANALRGINQVMCDNHAEPSLLTLGGVARSSNPAAAMRSIVQRHRLEALLILSPIPLSWLEPTLETGLPVVAINFHYDDPRIVCVLADHDAAVQRISMRIEEAGHRRCVALRGHFNEALLEGVNMTRVIFPEAGPVDWSTEHYSYFDPGAVQRLVSEHLARKHRPTLFLCWGYEAALGAAAMVRERGWSVPDDVSIVFVGSTQNPSQYSGEVVPVSIMSNWAATHLIDRINHRVDVPSEPVVVSLRPQSGTTLKSLGASP